MYRQQIYRKTSSSLNQTTLNSNLALSQSYKPLSSVVQRAQQDPENITIKERQQLEIAIGTRATRKILAGEQISWTPEFKGISAQLEGDSDQVGETIQTKLTVGQPDDKYEQEADRVADRIMRMSEPEVMAEAQSNPLLAIQRLNQTSDEKPHRQPEEDLEKRIRKEEEQEEKIVQAKEQPGQTPQVTPSLEARLAASQGQGKPLLEETQGFMESRFGQDFSSVRVHTGSEAAQLNRELKAQAFTHGQDVYFGAGKYSPESKEGKRLLAHELTHVVQQNNTNRDNRIQRQASSRIPRASVQSLDFNFNIKSSGEASYSRFARKEVVPILTLQQLKNFKISFLKHIQPDLAKLDELKEIRKKDVLIANKKITGELGPGIIWGSPWGWVKKLYEDQSEDCQKHVNELTSQREEEERLFASFNIWIPQANQFFVSLARLSALQILFGMTDSSEMIKKVKSGLKEAGNYTFVAQKSGKGNLDVPEADRQVVSALRKFNNAASDFRTSLMGYQIENNINKLKSEKSEKSKKEDDLTKINESIEIAGKIGKTVDFAIALMTKAQKIGAAKDSEELLGEGKNLATDTGKVVGFPTSVEELTKGIYQIAYAGKIEKISDELRILKSEINAKNLIVKKLELQILVNNYLDSANNFNAAGIDLDNRMIARQRAYLKFGEQIDVASRKISLSSKQGTAPIKGQEKFAKIMLLTSAIREVLALARFAKENYKSPEQVKEMAMAFRAIRLRKVKGGKQFSEKNAFSSAEIKAFESLYSQILQFHSQINLISKVLKPVEDTSSEIMQSILGVDNKENAAY